MNIQREDHSVTVIHGANDGIFDVAGCTVKTVQKSLVDAFNIGTDAIAFVNGKEVESTHKLNAGDHLEFVYRNGIKGLGDLLTPEDLMSRWGISPDEYLELQQLGLPTFPFKNGSIRHSEIAVDDWWKINGNIAPAPLLATEKQDASRSWLNPPATDPPPSHRFGPLEGTQEELASWIHHQSKSDSRGLQRKATNGVVWLREVHSRLNEIWFKTQRELDAATSRRNKLLPKPPAPT